MHCGGGQDLRKLAVGSLIGHHGVSPPQVDFRIEHHLRAQAEDGQYGDRGSGRISVESARVTEQG